MASQDKKKNHDNDKTTGSILDTFDPRKATKELAGLKPHPETGRLIDSYPLRRTKPMRVLCLGQSRTGTMATITALTKLGYSPFHMAVALGSPKTNLSLWSEALNAKFKGQGKKWGREEFDKLLGPFDALADVPAICFVEELVEAYPEAKVILTNRDVDSWLNSMDQTGGHILRWNWETISKWDHALCGPFWRFAQVVMPANFRTMHDFSSTSPARQAFYDHYELVRRIVPKERLLEYRVQEHWEPLCEFLGEPVPDEQFPRLNDAKDFVFAHRMMWWIGFATMAGKATLYYGVPIAAASIGIWWKWYQ